MKILEKLKSKFPLLNQIDFDILNPLPKHPNCYISKRGDVYGIGINVPSQNVERLFATFGELVPSDLSNILENSTRIVIELESIVTNRIRLYLNFGDFNSDYMTSTFPCIVENEEPTKFLSRIGFFIDKESGKVDEYKYYWSDPVTKETYNYRFNSAGTLTQTFKNRGSFHPNLESMPEFFEILKGIDELQMLGLCHITREDIDNSYVSINEFDGYPGKGFGSEISKSA